MWACSGGGVGVEGGSPIYSHIYIQYRTYTYAHIFCVIHHCYRLAANGVRA